MKFHFEGGAELARNLDQLSVRVTRKVMREALTDAAEPMRSDASRKAPHAPGAPDLRNSFVVSPVRASEDIATVAVGPARWAFWGLFQEFGTVHHGAQPFMRPAFEHNVRPALNILARTLWRLLASRGLSRRVQSDTPVASEGRTL